VVVPSIAGPSTQFGFYVVHRAPNAVTKAQVIIDGSPHRMHHKGTYPKPKGELYSYSTKLSVGTHEFTFRFVSEGDTVVLPVNDVPFGVQVTSFDLESLTTIPTLFPSQSATFVARYTSPSGTAPTMAQVQIGATTHPMTANSTDYKAGVDYTFATTDLGVGEYYLSFTFSDGTTSGNFAQKTGVAVMSLQLKGGSVTPAQGTTSTEFTFEVIYYHSSGVDPTSALVYVDGTPYTMTYVSGKMQSGAVYHAQVTLGTGHHEYLYVFAAGRSAFAYPGFPDSLQGPAVS
jgi:hypothetical protein